MDGERSLVTQSCVAQYYCPSPQMCARNIDCSIVGGRDTRDQVSHGKLVVKEYLDVA